MTLLLLLGFAPYVLIGRGTASFAAAKAIREKDPTAKLLIIGKTIVTIVQAFINTYLLFQLFFHH